MLSVDLNSDDLADFVETLNPRQIQIALEYAINTILNPSILTGTVTEEPDDPNHWEAVEENLRSQALYHMYEAGDDTDKLMPDFAISVLEIAYEELLNKLSVDFTDDKENADIQCLYNEVMLIKWITLIESTYLTPQNVLRMVLLVNYQ